MQMKFSADKNIELKAKNKKEELSA